MTYRVRIDPLAMRQIDQFATYLRDYDEDFALEQIQRLDRIFRFNLAESPLTWSYFPLTGAPYRGYLFRVERRTQYWIVYSVNEDSRALSTFCRFGTQRAIPRNLRFALFPLLGKTFPLRGREHDESAPYQEQRKVQMSTVTAAEIVSFWRQAGPQRWFAKDEDFDRTIRSRFLAAHEAAARGELAACEDSAQGALALVILLDQFPRNMFRGSGRAFATDALARAVADRALARGFDQATDETMRPFFYLPFMHSEAPADQDRSVRLHAALGDAERAGFAADHRDIVARFGRFPHRNRALGRDTTPAEQKFLDDGGFAG